MLNRSRRASSVRACVVGGVIAPPPARCDDGVALHPADITPRQPPATEEESRPLRTAVKPDVAARSLDGQGTTGSMLDKTTIGWRGHGAHHIAPSRRRAVGGAGCGDQERPVGRSDAMHGVVGA